MLFCEGVEDMLHKSYYLVGCGLYQKWDKSLDFLEALLTPADGAGEVLARSAVESFRQSMNKEDGGLKDDDELRRKLEAALTRLEDSKRCSDADVHELMLEALKQLPALEPADIEAQKRDFQLWQKLRHDALEEQRRRIDREQTIEAIRLRRKELGEKEELLYAFENWDQARNEVGRG
ncbi:hypothetical protein MRX96_028821 [Rhipicephalus microplus]